MEKISILLKILLFQVNMLDCQIKFPLPSPNVDYPISSIEILTNAKNKRYIACTSGRFINLIDVDMPTSVTQLEGHRNDVTKIVKSRNGSYFATGSKDRNVIVWRNDNRTIFQKFENHQGSINDLVFVPNDSSIISAGRDGKIVIQNIFKSNDKVELCRNCHSVNTLYIHIERNILFSGHENGEIKVWNLETRKLQDEIKLHANASNTIIVINDNFLISGSLNGKIVIYDLENKKISKEINGSSRAINDIKYHPQSDNLISASEDGVIDIWDLKNGNQKYSLTGHSDGINQLAIDFQRDILFSCAKDKSIIGWELNEYNKLASIKIVTNKSSIVTCPDSYFMMDRTISSNHFKENKYDHLKHNRPHIVLERLKSYALASKFSKFNNVWLERHKFPEDTTIINYDNRSDFPEVNIISEIPKKTKNETLSIKLNIIKNNNKNIKIIITQNNKISSSIKLKKTDSVVNEKVLLNLMNGNNNIQIFLDNGLEKKRIEKFQIYAFTKKEENLFIIGIELSKYKQKTFNINNTTNEVSKTLNILKRKNCDRKVYTELLYGENATKKNIISTLNSILGKVKINDQIFVIYSGHGIRDEESNFFLTTYLTNFENSSEDKESIDLEEFKELLKNAKSPNKLLLINSYFYSFQEIKNINIIKNNPNIRTSEPSRTLDYENEYNLTQKALSYFPEYEDENGLNLLLFSLGIDIFGREKEKSLFKFFTGLFESKKSNLEISFKDFLEYYRSNSTIIGAHYYNLDQTLFLNSLGIKDFRFASNKIPDSKGPAIFRFYPKTSVRETKGTTIWLKYNISAVNGINGVFVNGKRRTDLDLDKNRNTIFPINTKEGINSIEIKTEDFCGNLSKDQFTIEAIKEPKYGKFHALLIGIDKYKKDPLEYPTKDVDSIKKVLTNYYQFDQEHITILKNPTRDEIINKLASFSESDSISNKDNLLIFFAGHGSYNQVEDESYWIPAESFENEGAWVSLNDIKTKLKAIRAKHILLIVDACFGGRIFDCNIRGIENIDQRRNPSQENNDESQPSLNATYDLESRRAITSGNKDQEVRDKSVFLEHFLKKLKENKKDYIFSNEIFTEINRPVTNESSNHQKPLNGVICGLPDEGGDFIFFKKN